MRCSEKIITLVNLFLELNVTEAVLLYMSKTETVEYKLKAFL